MRKAPKATTARTTRTERMPYRNSRSIQVDSGTSKGLLVIPFCAAPLDGRQHVPERSDEFRELERQDELRRGTGPEALEGVEVLEHERLLVDPLRGSEDRREGLCVPFRVQDRGLSRAFRPQDRGLLIAFRDGDRRGLPPVGFDDDGSPAPFGGHLKDHCVRDVLGREDLPDLDVRDLDAPASRDLVEFRPEYGIDLLALR